MGRWLMMAVVLLIGGWPIWAADEVRDSTDREEHYAQTAPELSGVSGRLRDAMDQEPSTADSPSSATQLGQLDPGTLIKAMDQEAISLLPKGEDGLLEMPESPDPSALEQKLQLPDNVHEGRSQERPEGSDSSQP